MTIGARIIGPELAESLVKIWLGAEFQGGASARKVAKIAAAEARLGLG
jgi:ribose 5-phosphate isomerase B